MTPMETLPPTTDLETQDETEMLDPTDMLRPRRAAPALAMLALAALLCLLGLHTGNLAAPHADVTLLPTSFGSWVMTGSEKTDPTHLALDGNVASALALDSYTNRNYVNGVTGQQVQILVEYRRMGRGSFNHRPEECYPAAGYTLTGRTVTPIVYGGQSAQALTCVADYSGTQGHDHQVLLYWFATGHRVVSNFFLQQMEMGLGRLQPSRNGWAFVRVIAECHPGQEASALSAEKDFVQQASPAIIQSITTSAGK
jgi:EpsI family protein